MFSRIIAMHAKCAIGPTHVRTSQAKRRLILESLEVRQVLATFAVTASTDVGLPGELRQAVQLANLTPGPDLIEFQVGSVNLTLGQLPLITESVTLDGSVIPGLVQITAAPGARIFEVDDGNGIADQFVSMVELRLRGGDVGLVGAGGAILNREELFLNNCEVLDNIAAQGGGIANLSGKLTLQNVTLETNRAYTEGGGLLNVGRATANLMNSIVIGNLAAGLLPGSTFGGGISNVGESILSLDQSQVIGNQALGAPGLPAHGGGISNLLLGRVTATNSTIVENHSDDLGGGIFSNDDGDVTLQLSTQVLANSAGDNGGGIFFNRGRIEILDSTISENLTEHRGGGAALGFNSFGPTNGLIVNSKIFDNSTFINKRDGSGGGLFLGAANGGFLTTVDIQNSAITHNNRDPAGLPEGEYGGGIHASHDTLLTISGTEVSDNRASRQGGGISAASLITPSGPQVTISDSRIERNEAEAGGGILGGRAASLQIDRTTIQANKASGTGGGGLFLSAVGAGYANLTRITNSIISGNSTDSPSGNGGGLIAGPGVDLLIDRTEITNNQTLGRGGGVYLTELQLAAFPHTTSIQRSIISGNQARLAMPVPSDAYGGGVFAAAGATVEIEATTISQNGAERSGGGLVAIETERFEVRDSTVAGNKASQDGGGVLVLLGDARLSQTTISDNSANAKGGGLFVYSRAVNQIDVQHSTIVGNTVGGAGIGSSGAGIHHVDSANNLAQIHLDHTIVAQNVVQPFSVHRDILDGPGLAGSAPITATYSLIGHNAGTLFAVANPDANGNFVGGGLAPIDPLLGPLMNHGGPTETRQPLAGSPVIDRGDPIIAMPPMWDQRRTGFARLFGRIDIGALELQPDVDFDDDGFANCRDINALVQEIASMGGNPAFDLNGDGQVDGADLAKWLDDAPDLFSGRPFRAYLRGDANLDGFVDGTDFSIWNSNKFTPVAAWCRGDFNADGAIDGSDFSIWNTNKFTASPPLRPTGGPTPAAADAWAQEFAKTLQRLWSAAAIRRCTT